MSNVWDLDHTNTDLKQLSEICYLRISWIQFYVTFYYTFTGNHCGHERFQLKQKDCRFFLRTFWSKTDYSGASTNSREDSAAVREPCRAHDRFYTVKHLFLCHNQRASFQALCDRNVNILNVFFRKIFVTPVRWTMAMHICLILYTIFCK